jgi:hypothetical protein
MKDYKFETDEFGLTGEGIHLLRSRYNYETIPFNQIEKIRVKDSKIVNNWLILLIIGLASIVFSLYYGSVLLDVFKDDRINRIYIEEIMIPFLPLVFGGFMVYSSLRTGKMLIVTYNKKTKRLPLDKLYKQGKLDSFVKELNIIKGAEMEMAALV